MSLPNGGGFLAPDRLYRHHYDDTRRYVEALKLILDDREKVFELNARRVYPRVDAFMRSPPKT